MKDRKLKLKELSVKSFITQADAQKAETIKGGGYRQISGQPCSAVFSNGCEPDVTEESYCQLDTREICDATQFLCTQQGLGC